MGAPDVSATGSSPYQPPPTLSWSLGNFPQPQASGLGRLVLYPIPRDGWVSQTTLASAIGSGSIWTPSSASEIQPVRFNYGTSAEPVKAILVSQSCQGIRIGLKPVVLLRGRPYLSMEPTLSGQDPDHMVGALDPAVPEGNATPQAFHSHEPLILLGSRPV